MATPLAMARVIVSRGEAGVLRHGLRSAAPKQALAYASPEDKSMWGGRRIKPYSRWLKRVAAGAP